MRLVALRSIMYDGKQFYPKEKLPTNNQRMVEAWVKNKSAAWEDLEVVDEVGLEDLEVVDEVGLEDLEVVDEVGLEDLEVVDEVGLESLEKAEAQANEVEQLSDEAGEIDTSKVLRPKGRNKR
jgi:hypothetical protein